MRSSFDIIPVNVWERFCEGEPAAFSQIYYAYAQDMFAYGLCITKNRDLIKDCIHDVFVNAYNMRGSLQKQKVRYYLMRALRNELYRAFRDAKETVELEECENESTFFSVEDNYILKEQAENIRNNVQEMLSLLTSNQREAIHYRYIEELSLQEISDIMGISYQSVQNLIQRSIRKIKEKYNGIK
ncbi:MAG: sigma-70 family RNA polymerase sigma factor [Tannerella sp.]|jgi:RNA polymerase sigma factor (sigma-70 family)|nr:sigma-70 family RNA polymerase sigma factor [Tannerella sp.]